MAATPAGTKAYFDRIAKNPAQKQLRPTVLGATELLVSRIGFGGYRIHEFEPDHREALRTALTGGCNLIDTSTNYTDGSSERLIGEVTSELFERGEIKREEVVFVSKAGYVQGENLKDAKARAARVQGFPDMVEYQPDLWHNISPEYLEVQITRSLERLKLTSIDIYLLHNPEYFFKSGGNREAYYARIEKAFRHLESECDKGRIRYYGISSNTFPEPEARSDYTSLAKVLEIANTISPKHRFAVVQCPFNLYEPGAALIKNNNQESVFDLAAKAKLAVLTNRPFNASQRGRLVRLTSFPKHDEVEVKGGLHTTLGRAVELEKQAPGYPKTPPGLQWAHALRERMSDLDDVLQWRDALYQQIYPSIRQALNRVVRENEKWALEYQSVMQELLRLVTHDLENLAGQKTKLIDDQLVAAIPDLASSPTLSQKVLRIYLAFPQLTSILVGMRSPQYVQDVLSTGNPLATDKARETLDKLQRHRS